MCFKDLQDKLQIYFQDNILYNEAMEDIDGDESLIDSGYIDSTGIIGLVAFLENAFGIKVYDQEIIPENFDSINRIYMYINNKLEPACSTAAGGWGNGEM